MVTEGTRSSYDRIAAQYATVNAAMPPELAAAANRFLQLVGHAALILDLGCGAGRDMAWLADRGAVVVGCDISLGMLAQARNLTHAPLPRPTDGEALLQADMRHLGLACARFHGIWCCASLLHLPKDDAPVALAEIRRVLAPGGVLFLSVQEGTGEGWERCSYAPVQRWFSRYSQDDLAGLVAKSGLLVLQTVVTNSGRRRWIQLFAGVSDG